MYRAILFILALVVTITAISSLPDKVLDPSSVVSAQSPSFTISGRVSEPPSGTGTGISGVTLSLVLDGGMPITTQTDAGGNFSFTGVAAGSDYEVTPSKTNYVFNPVSQGGFNLSSNRELFFTGTTSTPTIDSVLPVAGRTSGGQQVVLTGSFANLSSVTFGGSTATWSYTNGTSEITVTTPAHVVGAVDIDLVPVSGSTYTKSNAFAYLPTVFTDNTLLVGVTTAKTQHIVELRQAVDALRAVAGLGPAAWTDAVLAPMITTIKAVHIQELRTNLDSVATTLGYATEPYTDPSLSSSIFIKKVHIEELRQRIRNIAG